MGVFISQGSFYIWKFLWDSSKDLTDAKIFMSATAVMLALLAFVYDYFTGFPKSFPVLLLCVVGYALLMSALSLFSFFFEKTYIYSGIKRDSSGFLTDCCVNVATVLKRFDHNYTVTITCIDSANKVVNTQSESCSLADLFDSKGNLGIDIFGMFISKLYSKVKVN